MAYEPKPGSFSLFKNDKAGVETRPDYTGDGMALDGTPIRISAWIKDGAKGKYMSCNIQPKEAKQEAKQERQSSQGAMPDDADIPF